MMDGDTGARVKLGQRVESRRAVGPENMKSPSTSQ